MHVYGNGRAVSGWWRDSGAHAPSTSESRGLQETVRKNNGWLGLIIGLYGVQEMTNGEVS